MYLTLVKFYRNFNFYTKWNIQNKNKNNLNRFQSHRNLQPRQTNSLLQNEDFPIQRDSSNLQLDTLEQQQQQQLQLQQQQQPQQQQLQQQYLQLQSGEVSAPLSIRTNLANGNLSNSSTVFVENSSSGEAEENHQSKILFVIVFVFFLCSLPRTILNLVFFFVSIVSLVVL